MKNLFITLLLVLTTLQLAAQPTVKIDATKTHQRITGFGGFVCSPQFQYNHMSTTEIKKVWGPTSTVGCNIMRVIIPVGRNSWSQSLATVKNAKAMGLIVFASPWGQPAEWKTNHSSAAKNADGVEGKLKRENWEDYAKYLNDYVKYLRDNGTDLDAISIQNEPDWPCTYDGCLWSPSEMAEFVKTYGRTIDCKIITPETLAVRDDYVNALNTSDVLPNFDIYGGHQYGGIQTAYKNLGKKGKELWMTEYLINWNEAENNTRNFDFSKDFFNFFRAINTCMLGDFNAWIHYAAKRYYGMLGDGQRGAGSAGTVTKRGYIMAHFAKYVTGTTRIDVDFGTSGLEGSAYLSPSGDTVVVVAANANDGDITVTLDLPFYTQEGKAYNTTKTKNMTSQTLNPEQETFRQQVTIPALSVSTVLFIRSRDRQPSDMKGSTMVFDRLDDMKTTNSTFGSSYKMSGKTKTFDHSNPLISTRTNASNGYVVLDERYSRLVLEVKKVTSTMNYNSAKTTLIYVNAAGKVASHDYGEVDFSQQENFNVVFDLSPTTLADGCRGLISITNNNWSSTLSVTLGNVRLDNGQSTTYAATLSGNYVEDDSYVQEYINDAACTSLDLRACTAIPSSYPWLQGTNRVAWLPDVTPVAGANLIQGDVCHTLVLSPDGGAFRPASTFQAQEASFNVKIAGARMLMLPFEATIPEGITAYAIADDLALTAVSTIAAHTPVLVMGSGEYSFMGTGEVSFAKSAVTKKVRGTYTAIQLYAGDYVLGTKDNKWGFSQLTDPAVLSPFDVYVSSSSAEAFLPLPETVMGIQTVSTGKTADSMVYDIQGRRVVQPTKGLYISNGKKRLSVSR